MVNLTYIKIAAVIFLVLGSWHIRGRIADGDISELNHKIAVQALQQQETVAMYTKQLQGVANQVEKQYAEAIKQNQEQLNRYRALVRERGGLYDPATNNGNSTTTGSPSNNTASTSGTRLSPELTEFLITQAGLADMVVIQFLTCQKYVQGITKEKNE